MKTLSFILFICLCNCKQNGSIAEEDPKKSRADSFWVRGNLESDKWALRYVILKDQEGFHVWVEQSDEDRTEWFSWGEAEIYEFSDTRILFGSPWGFGIYELIFENRSLERASIKLLGPNNHPLLEARVAFEAWSQEQQKSPGNLRNLED